jgi:hypothetical protein
LHNDPEIAVDLSAIRLEVDGLPETGLRLSWPSLFLQDPPEVVVGGGVIGLEMDGLAKTGLRLS